MDRERFYQCPCCHTWFSSQDILESSAVEPLGMTFDGDGSGFNLLFFNHVAPGCGSTFAIEARRFETFLSEMPPPDVKAGQEGCEHHCTSMHDLTACRVACHWAPYRRFLLRLREKRGLPAK